MKEYENSFIPVFFCEKFQLPFGTRISMFFQISLRIFKEASDDQQNDDPDWKCSDDGYGLQICHGIIGEDQGDG